MNTNGTLYIVATPIGNLQDITLRAIDVLKNAEFIACEDTRRAGMLLKHVHSLFGEEGTEYKRPMLMSYYEQNEVRKIEGIINVLKNEKNVVLISDAGTPTISDPGFKLVRECVAQGIKVESIPGPSSVISSLVVSGLPTDKFMFVGYLPIKQGNRLKLLQNIKTSLESVKQTVIFFEAPHKLIKTLTDVQTVFGNISIVVERELTKIHEEVRHESVSQSLEHFTKTNPKGEFVILFNLG